MVISYGDTHYKRANKGPISQHSVSSLFPHPSALPMPHTARITALSHTGVSCHTHTHLCAYTNTCVYVITLALAQCNTQSHLVWVEDQFLRLPQSGNFCCSVWGISLFLSLRFSLSTNITLCAARPLCKDYLLKALYKKYISFPPVIILN
jgi:hypothetical protein